MKLSNKLNNSLAWYRLTDTYLRFKRMSYQLQIFKEKLIRTLGSLSKGCGSENSSDWSESAQSPPVLK